ncbi:TetR/AcrR family transcriptional regulator [Paenibacillus sp. J5C_2022]|uniref:TetR/AcrR family transcriptional regulator n=1 Tax=Paenibacillus sp. J5C2022 TaxID=2977129 RepID=UPI0021D0DE56|nr:TetR/AcrR family transcriptional regulator [Paenibacillus sp. J5C2022]MCU6709265.1 TetR/AcrR family transcriptional regulator [Paenibacillus sp. J5C2022]
MIQKHDILAAAVKIIEDKGLNNLTLEAIAAEAGVSKGGLLHHFRNKEDLIRGLNERSVESFQGFIQEEMKTSGSYVQSFAKASFKQLNDPDEISMNASMLAAIANYKELLSSWSDEYAVFRHNAAGENAAIEKSLIVRLVCDGLMFSKMFNLDPPSEEEQRLILAELENMMKEPKA